LEVRLLPPPEGRVRFEEKVTVGENWRERLVVLARHDETARAVDLLLSMVGWRTLLDVDTDSKGVVFTAYEDDEGRFVAIAHTSDATGRLQRLLDTDLMERDRESGEKITVAPEELARQRQSVAAMKLALTREETDA